MTPRRWPSTDLRRLRTESRPCVLGMCAIAPGSGTHPPGGGVRTQIIYRGRKGRLRVRYRRPGQRDADDLERGHARAGAVLAGPERGGWGGGGAGDAVVQAAVRGGGGVYAEFAGGGGVSGGDGAG